MDPQKINLKLFHLHEVQKLGASYAAATAAAAGNVVGTAMAWV